MAQKHALILLGGMWHDFDGFARSMRPLFEGAGWAVESSYDLEHLTHLGREVPDLLIHYTCFTKPAKGQTSTGPEGLSLAQTEGLCRWVQNGGAFLSAHASSVRGTSPPGLTQLTGGYFVEHPPEFTFTAYPVYRRHPIVEGIKAFSVYDEMYIEQYDPNVEIHMMTVANGVAHPLVWSKSEGRGRVAHVALGHSAAVWELAPYRQLMLQTAKWLIG
jgi:type 1 glutamine amidotransferase